MSKDVLVWVANLKDLTLSERGVLVKLADHANKDGSNAFPAVKKIAAWAGLQERNVRLVLNRLLARRLIEVEGANGRKGGGRQPTIYRVVVAGGFNPKTWREADVHAWQDAHVAPAAAKAPRAGAKRQGGNNQHAGNVAGRQKVTCLGPERAAKSDTLGRHSIAAEPKEEPVLSKSNRSALPRGPQGGRGVGKQGQGASGPKAKLQVGPAVQHPDVEAIRRQRELTARAEDEAQEGQATGMLLALQPKLGRAEAECEVRGLRLKYDRTWEPVIGALSECGQAKPPPANPLRWLRRHAARHGNGLLPDF